MSFQYPLPPGIRQVAPDYVSDGSTTVFGFPFRLWSAADLYVGTAPAGTIPGPGNVSFTRLTLNVDYTVTINGAYSASVTLLAAQPVGTLIRLQGLRTPSRTTSVINDGVVQSAPMESELDVVEATLQEVRRDVVAQSDLILAAATANASVASAQAANVAAQLAAVNAANSASTAAQIAATNWGVWASRAAFAAGSPGASILSVMVLGYATAGDNGHAVYVRLGSAPSPVRAGHVQTANGAWWAIVGDALAFEALGGNPAAADNTTALTDAAAWFGARGRSGRIVLQGVSYTFTGTVNIPYGGVTIEGQGYTSTLYFNNGAADCIVVGTDAAQVDGFKLAHCKVAGPSVIGSLTDPPKTGGRAIYLNRVHFGFVEDVFFYALYSGIDFYRINEVTVQNCTVQTLQGAWAFYFRAGASNALRADGLTFINTVVNGQNLAGVNTADGLWWDGAANTLNTFGLTFLGCGRGLVVKNSANDPSWYPTYGEFNNLIIDNCSLIAVQFDAGLAMQFTNCVITTTSSTSNNALVINPDSGRTSRFQFVNCYIGNCGQEAAKVNGAEISFESCHFVDGGKQGANTYDALVIVTGAQRVTVDGCTVHNVGESQNWRYAYQVQAGTFGIKIRRSSAQFALTGSILWSNTDSLSGSEDIVPYTGVPTADDGYVTPTVITPPTAGQTLTGAQALGGILGLGGSPGALTLNMPTAAALVAALTSPGYNRRVQLKIQNTTGSVMTFNNAAGVFYSGNVTSPSTFAIAANTTKIVDIVFNNCTPGSEAVTMFVS